MTDLESRDRADFAQWFEREWPYEDLYWTDSSNRCFCTWSRFDPQPLWECWQAARAGNEELRLQLASVEESERGGHIRILGLEKLLNEIMATINMQKSVAHGPIENWGDLRLAIRHLQECYADAALARNGLYTKMQARAEKAEKANKELRECLRAFVEDKKTELEKRVVPHSRDQWIAFWTEEVARRAEALLERGKSDGGTLESGS